MNELPGPLKLTSIKFEFILVLLTGQHRASVLQKKKKNDFFRLTAPISKNIGSHYFHGCPSLWLGFPGFGLQCQLKPNCWYPPVKSAHPVHSCPSLPSPPSLPQSRLGREERAETPHWPRWLAANQLQPKVIGSRWGNLLVTRAGGTSCLLKRRKRRKKNECKAQGEWKRDSKSVSCSGQLGELLKPWAECGGMRRKES